MDKPQELIHPRDEIMQTMDRIYRYRMTTTSGGNLSIRDEEDIWIGRDGELEGAVIFLAAPSSSFVTGVILPVDGGWSAW